MKAFLYWCVGIISQIHSKIMHLNDAYEMHFTDKELHFLVIGLLGMAMVFAIHPLFRYMAKHNHEMVITWIYVFTVIVVITFAIEIGQKVTNSGNMEFADIMYGLVGFLFMFLIFSVFRGLYYGILRLLRYYKNKQKKPPQVQ